MASPTALDALRAQLDDEKASLQRQLTELGAEDFDENFADSGQVAAEQGETRAIVATLTDQLSDVDNALAKVDGGTYGRCEVCDQEIAEARLEAMLATRYCINHA